jgi:hypothetical protein
MLTNVDTALEAELGERAYRFLDYAGLVVPTIEFFATEVCWTLMIMMSIGGLDLPHYEREFLGEALSCWADMEAQNGKMRA